MKKAIVLGGTHDQIALIEKLKDLGYYVILIDYFNNPPARMFAHEHIIESTLNKEIVLEIAIQKHVSLVLTICMDSSLSVAAYVSEKLNLPFHIDYKTALSLTNKSLMKDIFLINEIPSSRYCVLNDITFNDIGYNYPLVVKPVDSSSSKGITKVDFKKDINSAIKTALDYSISKSLVIEEYVHGEEFSADLIVLNSKPYLIMVTKNIKSVHYLNRFTINQSFFPATHDKNVLNKIFNIAQKIVNAYNLVNTPLLIQMIHNNEDLSVIEFSARIGGGSKHHFIKKVTGFDILQAFVDILHDKKIEPVKILQNTNFALINYIYAKNGIIKDFYGFDELVKSGVIDNVFYYKTIGMKIVNNQSSADRPVGYLITAKDEKEISIKLKKINENIKILDNNDLDIILHEF